MFCLRFLLFGGISRIKFQNMLDKHLPCIRTTLERLHDMPSVICAERLGDFSFRSGIASILKFIREYSDRHKTHVAMISHSRTVGRKFHSQRIERFAIQRASTYAVETRFSRIVFFDVAPERQHDMACTHIIFQTLVNLAHCSLFRCRIVQIRHGELAAIALKFAFESSRGIDSGSFRVGNFQLISREHFQIFVQRLLRCLLLVVFMVHVFKFRQSDRLSGNRHQNRIFL